METRLYQTTQIRQLERIATEQLGLQENELMARAGLAAFTVLKDLWPDAKIIRVVCGAGNNGGDGYVLARLAHQQGLDVKIYYLGNRNQLKGAAKVAHDASLAAAVPLESLTSALGRSQNLKPLFFNADVIVDALLGIGLQGEVRAELATVMHALNALSKPVLALDTPSGLDSDTGCVLGCAVQATATVTFMGIKQGLLTGQGVDYCGQVICDELQLPKTLLTEVAATWCLLDFSSLQRALKPRKPSAHKGHYGHVVILGGDYAMPGAVRLTAEAALRAGAGLVSVITHPEHLSTVTGARPEIMSLSCERRRDVKALLARATVLVVGPGLGQSRWSKRLWKWACQQAKPMVVDADALNLLAKTPRFMPQCVLTPHPGEAARLLMTSIAKIQGDRFAAVRQLQQRYGGVCVLKGAGTLIEGSHSHSFLCREGNPGMASGGMGDVLTGLIAGFLAQGFNGNEAAQLGVMVHAKAGDKAAQHWGQRGLLAHDLLLAIHSFVNP